MRLLIGPPDCPGPSHQLSDDQLAELYAAPRTPWLRVNMVSTLDGAAQGDDGRSGGINNAADKRVFHALRAAADCLVVGAGTVRAEGYRPAGIPLVVVSRSADVPETLRGSAPGAVLMATTEAAPHLDEARELLGADHVWTLGADTVDLVLLRQRLVESGWTRILSEGGPGLLRDLLAAGVVDELCLTWVPRLIAGDHLGITAGAPVDVPLEPALLLEEDGTLLGRWLVRGTLSDSGVGVSTDSV